jgi:DNA adenine methylase
MRGKSFSPSVVGVQAKTVDRIEQFAPRLRGVKVYGGDYRPVVEQYDGKDTVHFLDPPYFGYNVDVGEDVFNEQSFCDLLRKLKGRFLMTYGIRGELPKLVKEAGFDIRRIRTRRSIGSMRGVGGPSILTQLLVSNYTLAAKSVDGLREDGWDVDEDRPVSVAVPVSLVESEIEDEASISDLEKAQPFGTFGGSFHYAKRIVPMIPAHKTYVEPFAGAAAVLHAKEPSEKEVLADLDPDVVFLHRSVKEMTAEQVEQLADRFEWKVSQESFAKARDLDPKDDLERFYKLVFVRTHARDCRPDGTHVAGQHLGSTTNPEKYLKAAERLQNVTILRQDYQKTIKKFDGPDTFFFIDPPYPDEWFDKNAVVNLEEFIGVLKGIEGKFIAVLNNSPENVAAFKSVGKVFRLKVREASGKGGAKQAMRLFCANFPVHKSEDIPELEAFAKSSTLLKGIDPGDERFVFGIVLEPEVVDAQGDIYSAEEIGQAAHRFMEEFGGLGLMHQVRVNDQVKILESYLAPVDFELGGVAVKKGTWLLGVHVVSDELWGQVKDGTLSGFSIGGTARKVPEAVATDSGDAAGEP